MKLTLLTLAAAVGLSTAAQAANLDTLFNNSVELTTEVGGQTIVSKLMYNADGTITGANGSAGTWEVKGSELCTTLTRAENGQGFTGCSPLAAAEGTNVGDTWAFSPSDAVTLNGKLVAGR